MFPSALADLSIPESEKQFVLHFLTCYSAKEAYKRVFPDTPDYIALTKGAHLLQKPKVVDYLRDKIKDKELELDILAERTLTELAAIAYMDPAELYNPLTGSLYTILEMPPHVRAAISEITVLPDNKVTYKLGGKQKALDQLVKITKLLDNVLNVDIVAAPITEKDKAERIKALLARAAERAGK